MNSYHLNTYSDTRHNSTIIIGSLIGSGCLGIAAINKQPFILCISLLVAVMIVAKLLANKFYKATAIFSVSDLGFTVSWTRNFAIFPEPDYNLEFENLQEYVFEPWGETYRLKVKTKEGKTLRFLFKGRKNDEFSYTAFFDNLQNSIKTYNNKDTDPINDLQIGRTFWQSKIAQIAAVIIAAALIWRWTVILSEEQLKTNVYKLIIGIIVGLLLILRVVYAVFPFGANTENSKKNNGS